MAHSKKTLALIFFGFLLIAGINATGVKQYVNYYANNYNNQAAAASQTGSTTAYNQALGGWGGLGATTNYYNNNYNNQAAYQSSSGNTVAYQSAMPYGLGGVYGYGYGYPYYGLGLGSSGLNYYSNNYANQAAYASQTGSTTAYNTVMASPYAAGLDLGYGYGYGYPYYGLGLGSSGLNYYSNNYANQAAYASQTGNTVAYQSALAYPYGYGYGFPYTGYGIYY